jgi:hypothetical protein
MVFLGQRKNGKHSMRGEEPVGKSDLGWTLVSQSNTSMQILVTFRTYGHTSSN